jgi:hypothetical protein
MERRRDARLAAERQARAQGAPLMPSAASDTRMPYQEVRVGSNSPLLPHLSKSGSGKIVVKIAGRPVNAAAYTDSSSYSATSNSAASMDSGEGGSSAMKPEHDVGAHVTPPSREASLDSSDDYTPLPAGRRQSKQRTRATKAVLPRKQQGSKADPFALPASDFKPHSRSPLLEQKKEFFEKVWKEQNLGVHMPASDLADSVKMMSAVGFDPQTAKNYAQSKIKDAPVEYRDAYAERARQWNMAISNARKSFLARDPEFEKMDDKRRYEKLYQKASQSLQLRQARITSGYQPRLHSRLRQEKMQERSDLVDDIGQAFRRHLAEKKMNFDTMTPEQLEKESRTIRYNTAVGSQYTRYLLEYIGKHRPGNEILRFRSERNKHNARKAKGPNKESVG